jgi:hypothetical protein
METFCTGNATWERTPERDLATSAGGAPKNKNVFSLSLNPSTPNNKLKEHHVTLRQIIIIIGSPRRFFFHSSYALLIHIAAFKW